MVRRWDANKETVMDMHTATTMMIENDWDLFVETDAAVVGIHEVDGSELWLSAIDAEGTDEVEWTVYSVEQDREVDADESALVPAVAAGFVA